jgi:hypothetical protein
MKDMITGVIFYRIDFKAVDTANLSSHSKIAKRNVKNEHSKTGCFVLFFLPRVNDHALRLEVACLVLNKHECL